MLTHNNDANSYSTYIAQPLAQAQNMAGTVMHGTIEFIGSNKVNIGKIALYAGTICGIWLSGEPIANSKHGSKYLRPLEIVLLSSSAYLGNKIYNTIYDTIFNIKREKTISYKRQMLVEAVKIAFIASCSSLILADHRKSGPYRKFINAIHDFLLKKISFDRKLIKIFTDIILVCKATDVAGNLSRAAMNRIWPKVTNITQAVSDSNKIEEKVESNLPKNPLNCDIDDVLDEDPQPAKSPASEKAAPSTSTKIADKTDPLDKAKSDLIDLIQARKAAENSQVKIVKAVADIIKPMIEDFFEGEDDKDCMVNIWSKKSIKDEKAPLSNKDAFNKFILSIAIDIANNAHIILTKYKDARSFHKEFLVINYKKLLTSHSLPVNNFDQLSKTVKALDEEISKGLDQYLPADINQDTEAEIPQVSPAASEAIPADPEEIITFVENILENVDDSFIEELFSESESQALSDELDKIIFEERPLDEEAIK